MCVASACSNVGYRLPLGLGSGWLSAAGTLSSASDEDLRLHFDRFWVDRGGAEPLRPDISPEAGALLASDQTIF
jgi:hypothetical protein